MSGHKDPKKNHVLTKSANDALSRLANLLVLVADVEKNIKARTYHFS
jgi:hypothetical protein